MDKNKKVGFFYSWPGIILMMFIFWPISLYLIYKRVSIDRKAGLSVGKTMCTVGYVFIAFSLFALWACVSEGITSDDVVIIGIFLTGAIALVFYGKKIRAKAERFKKYLAVIINGKQYQIDTIASSINVSYDIAKKDIQEMIDKGYFNGAYINEGTHTLVLVNNQGNVNNQNVIEDNHNDNYTVHAPKLVTCKCCGANNNVYGDNDECEFCGSLLSK